MRKWLIGLFFCAVSGGLAGCVTPDQGYEDAVSVQRAAGYQWKQLEKCRPPKDDALAASIIINGSTKLVCGTLVPPQAKSGKDKTTGEGQNKVNFASNAALKQSDASNASSGSSGNNASSATSRAASGTGSAADGNADGAGFNAIEDDPLIVDVSDIADSDGMGNAQLQWQISTDSKSWLN
ncbi:MAG: hypothetical protein ACO3WT_08575, partial [Candidatus Puniceispirillaceae bacterium]